MKPTVQPVPAMETHNVGMFGLTGIPSTSTVPAIGAVNSLIWYRETVVRPPTQVVPTHALGNVAEIGVSAVIEGLNSARFTPAPVLAAANGTTVHPGVQTVSVPLTATVSPTSPPMPLVVAVTQSVAE